MENFISQSKVSKDLLDQSLKNIEYNEVIIKYYVQYQEELKDLRKKEIIKNKIDNIALCNNFWLIDRYEMQKIKDFKTTNLCHDKFCNNCKKVKQASRMAKYMPQLKEYDNISYHLTLTSPKVKGEDLKEKIKFMAQSFRTLNLYISGKKKMNGISFESWGYKGALRSLEVTFENDSYHPHYHCILVLKNLGGLNKTIKNDYSYSYGELKNLFSKEEVLIQKLWYLIINKIRITKKNIDKLDIGYSCKLDKLGIGDYNEVFKYMTKEITADGNVFTYNNFKILYEALYRVKQIQGYGCLYRITDKGDIDSFIEDYNKFIELMQEIEYPIKELEKISDLLKDNKYTLISRKSYMKYMTEKGN